MVSINEAMQAAYQKRKQKSGLGAEYTEAARISPPIRALNDK